MAALMVLAVLASTQAVVAQQCKPGWCPCQFDSKRCGPCGKITLDCPLLPGKLIGGRKLASVATTSAATAQCRSGWCPCQFDSKRCGPCGKVTLDCPLLPGILTGGRKLTSAAPGPALPAGWDSDATQQDLAGALQA